MAAGLRRLLLADLLAVGMVLTWGMRHAAGECEYALPESTREEWEAGGGHKQAQIKQARLLWTVVAAKHHMAACWDL